MSLPSKGLIKHDLHLLNREIAPLKEKFESKTLSGKDGIGPNGEYRPSELTRFLALKGKINKKEADLVTETRRYLKRLVKALGYKSDIYTPNGRLFACDGKFSTDGTRLFWTDENDGIKVELDPDKLTNGHGRGIYPDGDY